MERLETRELGYFLAVAQELHFGHAARRLGIAQPPLSRAIQQLERKLGVELFTRTSQRVALTEAGEVLLEEAQRVLDAADAAASRTQRAGKRSGSLVIAMKPGIDHGLLPTIMSAFAADPAALPIDILVGGAGEQTPLVRQGRADVAFVHDHTDLGGLDTVEFLVESQVLLVPEGHRLAGRASVHMRDVRDEPLPCWPTDRPNIRDVGQLMQLVVLGLVIAVLPETVRRHLRDGLVCIPVEDAEPTRVMIGWPEDSHSPALAAFVRIATKIADESQPARATMAEWTSPIAGEPTSRRTDQVGS